MSCLQGPNASALCKAQTPGSRLKTLGNAHAILGNVCMSPWERAFVRCRGGLELASPTGTVLRYQPVFRGEWVDQQRAA